MIYHLTTRQILDALKVRLAAIPKPNGEAGEKLFEVVDLSIDKNFGDTMRQIYEVKDRVALLVPGGDQFQTEASAHSASIICWRHVDVLVADRDYVDGRTAAFGDGDGAIGVVAMKDKVLAALAEPGEFLAVPVESEPIEIADSQKDTPGRQTWVCGFRILAGQGSIGISRNRIQTS